MPISIHNILINNPQVLPSHLSYLCTTFLHTSQHNNTSENISNSKIQNMLLHQTYCSPNLRVNDSQWIPRRPQLEWGGDWCAAMAQRHANRTGKPPHHRIKNEQDQTLCGEEKKTNEMSIDYTCFQFCAPEGTRNPAHIRPAATTPTPQRV